MRDVPANRPTTVLVTGAAGLLGTWLRRTAPAGVEVVGTVHRRGVDGRSVRCDLRHRTAVESAVAAAAPSAVIHAAYAKNEPSIVDATRHVVAAGVAHGAAVVHVSTDAVFSGDGPPRFESDAPDPVTDYGRWKAAAEAIVDAADPTAAIVRLPLIVSSDPDDHVVGQLRCDAARRGAGDEPPARWFTDEMRRPALARELAVALWRIAELGSAERSGVWHLAGAELLSRAEHARRAAAAIGVDPTTLDTGPTPTGVVRPRHLDLVDDRARSTVGWAPTAIWP